ncbi:response regulator transcription factor [Aquibacillus rhizosphaerae]|uniref:Response regulator transcription factor n=1 Tax=Aquibacillus rhizosphaerae TaxID=3051431 RepID=A0ABT7L5U8_9BACI|nr:response regulator transcription factor [Aquibacillus sp. LR5S19]MDL4840577.1 response regulator transcription factor [Aquibacillus sp. LR5S19]
MTLPNILIVEDEQKLARVLQLELGYEGYQTMIANNGNDALVNIKAQSWDLILLDILLPQLSGLEVLRRVRNKDKTTPIILLTARDEVHDKVSGLDLGANDYITKPFQIEEVLARIRVHLRNMSVQPSEQLSVGDLSANIQTREVTREGQSVELTPREFDLLIYLMKNENQVLQRDQLIEHVWGYDYVGDTNVVDVYIRYLRQKIDTPFATSYIHTVRGVGYSLKDKKL